MKQGCWLLSRIHAGRCKTMIGATKKPSWARAWAWAYPKVKGFSPPERWGHSSCYYRGFLYVFGGCYGGLHFGEVVALDLKTLEWRSLQTTGEQPGSRDSHSAVIVGERMVIFGGTNGFKKINELHVLDLQSGEWTQPAVEGNPPSARESHSATLVGDSKMVIFGGSGEGKGNYLNDVHVLDVKAMKWISPEVRGETPAKRDSHSAVAVGNKIVVYGGDCGDHYLGDVDILDLFTFTWSRFTWSRMVVQGSNSPGVRAGHASVVIGSKVYIIGGVGDREYYNDVWMLDINGCTWIQLELSGPEPQGRFSHTAVLAEGVIAIYGGCGEDERPLDDIIFLQLGRDCFEEEYSKKIPSTVKMSLEEIGSVPVMISSDVNEHFGENDNYTGLHADAETDSEPCSFVQRPNQTKRRKKLHLNTGLDVVGDEEQSQQSSPSEQSEQDPVAGNRMCGVQVCRQQQVSQQISASHNHMIDASSHLVRLPPAVQLLHVRVPQQSVSSTPSLQSLLTVHNHNSRRVEIEPGADQSQRLSAVAVPNLVGADVRGVVDAAFDSGYLMTAQVNGRLFRGLLFSPSPGVVLREPSLQDSSNNNVNSGIILGRPVSRTIPVQPNLSYLNAALAGSSVAQQLHVGTVIHPATLVQKVPTVPPAHARGAEGGPNIAVRAATFPLPVPTQDARCDARPISGGVFGASQLSSFGSPRRNADNGHPQKAELEKGLPLPSPGIFQTAMSGHCRWVWQPLYTGCPPAPPVQPEMGNDGRITVAGGGHVEIETSASENGTTVSDLQGITLRIGGPGQH